MSQKGVCNYFEKADRRSLCDKSENQQVVWTENPKWSVFLLAKTKSFCRKYRVFTLPIMIYI